MLLVLQKIREGNIELEVSDIVIIKVKTIYRLIR